jgi:hypothetical protein
MILDQTYGAIQQMPTVFGWGMWTWSAVEGTGVVTKRFVTIGSQSNNFSVVGTDDKNFSAIGTDDKNFSISGV